MMSGLPSYTSLLTDGLDEGHRILGGNVRQKRFGRCHGAYAALAILRNRHSWPLAEGIPAHPSRSPAGHSPGAGRCRSVAHEAESMTVAASDQPGQSGLEETAPQAHAHDQATLVAPVVGPEMDVDGQPVYGDVHDPKVEDQDATRQLVHKGRVINHVHQQLFHAPQQAGALEEPEAQPKTAVGLGHSFTFVAELVSILEGLRIGPGVAAKRRIRQRMVEDVQGIAPLQQDSDRIASCPVF